MQQQDFPWANLLTEWRAKAGLNAKGRRSMTHWPRIRRVNRISFLPANQYETRPGVSPNCIFRRRHHFAPGEIVLRYRRLISMFAPSPFDVWTPILTRVWLRQRSSRFADHAEIGRSGAIRFRRRSFIPEIARALSNQAPKFPLVPTLRLRFQVQTPTPKINQREMPRAGPEKTWLMSFGNSGGLFGIDIPPIARNGGSEIN